MKSIVILISGRGSNMEAILKAALPLEIRAVISNRPEAAGLATAKAAGIPVHGLDHKLFVSRDAFDQSLMQCIDQYSPDYVILAGFMRVLTEAFIDHYPRRIVNIHPSLLPSFPGLHTHRQALDAGVKIHGATVHFVTPQLDHGPIIIQAAVPVLPDDTEASLAARVLVQEHRIYPQALRWLAADQVEFSANDVVQVQKHRVSDTAGAQYLTAPGK
jgi:phosphoribosylglycinamide formyltransferase 1